MKIKLLRQYRTKIACGLRSQIFRQAEAAPRIVQIERSLAVANQAKFVQDDGKDASKACAKLLGGLCAVLP